MTLSIRMVLLRYFRSSLGDPKPMEHQRFVEHFLFPERRQGIDRPELAHETLPCAFGIVVSGRGIRRDQLALPHDLLRLRRVAQDVLALVPFAPRYRYDVAKHVPPHGTVKPRSTRSRRMVAQTR
jgi:hypothetical protein